MLALWPLSTCTVKEIVVAVDKKVDLLDGKVDAMDRKMDEVGRHA